MSVFDPNNIEKALEFLSPEDRKYVLDAVYCEIHNSWGALQGNTALNDTEWFANWIYRSFHGSSFDMLTDEEKRFWINLADVCLQGLPMLMSRMESRYEGYRNALDVLLKAQWAAEHAEKDGATMTTATASGQQASEKAEGAVA